MLNIIISIFQILTAIGIIGFWISFYLSEYKNRKMSEVEYKHELSFPLPDLGWVTPNLIVAAIGLLSNQAYGFIFSISAGGGMVFLGFIDLAFAIQNGKFNRKEHGMDAYVTIAIVILMMVLGPLFISYGGINLL
ncbi:MAG: hypothetical protein ACW986_12630 [Promethearchaeota archaeon]